VRTLIRWSQSILVVLHLRRPKVPNPSRPFEIHGNEIELQVFEWETKQVRPSKTIVLTCNIWVGGDPHIKKWDGGW
jgi:hypothetical protein